MIEKKALTNLSHLAFGKHEQLHLLTMTPDISSLTMKTSPEQSLYFTKDACSIEQKVSDSKKVKLSIHRNAIFRKVRDLNSNDSCDGYELVWNHESSFGRQLDHGLKNNTFEAYCIDCSASPTKNDLTDPEPNKTTERFIDTAETSEKVERDPLNHTVKILESIETREPREPTEPTEPTESIETMDALKTKTRKARIVSDTTDCIHAKSHELKMDAFSKSIILNIHPDQHNACISLLSPCQFKFQTLKDLNFLITDKHSDSFQEKIRIPMGTHVAILESRGEKILAILQYHKENSLKATLYISEIYHHHTGKIEKKENEKEMKNDTETLTFQPIGIFESVFPEKNGTPRQGSIIQNSRGRLKIIKPTSGADALEGLESFSHVWLIFVFHRNAKIRDDHSKIRPPRLNGKKIGLFASRSPHRPNPIGLTSAKIDRIEKSYLYLSGVDILDQTPILDIKPYVEYSDKIESTLTPPWIESPTVGMLPPENITFAKEAYNKLKLCLPHLKFYDSLEDIEGAIIQVLQSDPRPVYMRKKMTDKLYGFRIDKINVRCSFQADRFHVEDIELW